MVTWSFWEHSQSDEDGGVGIVRTTAIIIDLWLVFLFIFLRSWACWVFESDGH